MNKIVTIEQVQIPQVQPVTQAVTPLTMIERAIERGASPEMLEKLLDLQERFEANHARKDFISAMAAARTKFKPIIKKNEGYAKRYMYETLSDVMDAVDGALSENGFSYDWETEDLADGRIRVTCVVTHESGHSRRNSLSGRPEDTADAKANMNGHQRMGGAVTYLQRYTLKAALGIAASMDTDGQSDANAQAKSINADEYQFIGQLIEDTQSIEAKVLAFVKAESLETLTRAQYQMAVAALQKRAKQMKAGGDNAATNRSG